MIRKAVGTLISRTAVAATMNRTSHRFAARKSTIGFPNRTTTRTRPTVRSSRIGMTVNRIFPASVRRLQDRATAVTRPCSLVDVLGPMASRGSALDLGDREADRGGGVPRSLVDSTHDRV